MNFGDYILEELVTMEADKSPSFFSMLSISKKLESIMSIPARELITKHVEAVLRAIDSDGGRAKARMLIGRAVKRALGSGDMDRDPLSCLPKMRPRSVGRAPSENAVEVLTLDEQLRIMTTPSTHADVWRFLLASGLRVSEAAAVSQEGVEHLDDFYSKVTIEAQVHAKWKDRRETKTANVREIVIPTWALPFGYPAFGVTEARVLQLWHRDLGRVGISKRRLHATRHTYITTMNNLKIEESVIRDMTHPKGRDAFSGYLHIPLEKKLDAARRWDAALRGE